MLMRSPAITHHDSRRNSATCGQAGLSCAVRTAPLLAMPTWYRLKEYACAVPGTARSRHTSYAPSRCAFVTACTSALKLANEQHPAPARGCMLQKDSALQSEAQASMSDSAHDMYACRVGRLAICCSKPCLAYAHARPAHAHPAHACPSSACPNLFVYLINAQIFQRRLEHS